VWTGSFLALTSLFKSSNMFSQTSINTIESSKRVGDGGTLMVWGAGIVGKSWFGWVMEDEGVSRLGSVKETEAEKEPKSSSIWKTCSSSSLESDISMLDISRIGLGAG